MPGQNDGNKKKVAILGGGIAALTAAFELTSPRNPKRDEYEVTVYQLGWRCGGKGASGRNLRPEYSYRIEEHGVHVFMGFYENAFRLMREAYEELGRPPGDPLATWPEAFKKHSYLVLFERFAGQWFNWPLTMPENLQTPCEGGLLPSLLSYMEMALEWPRAILEDLTGTAKAASPSPGVVENVKLVAHRAVSRTLLKLLKHFVPVRLDELRIALEHRHAPSRRTLTERILALGKRLVLAFIAVGLRFIRWSTWLRLRNRIADVVIREQWVGLNFCIGNVLGAIAGELHRKGLDSINSLDYREWLAPHLLDDGGLTLTSPLACCLYEAGFAYVKGDPNTSRFEAGTCLRIMIRMFLTYKGAVCYKMQAGMGDVIFGPLYEVLRQRGVDFRFFHRVEDLVPNADGTAIEEIVVEEQAQLRDPQTGYDPLIEVKKLPCWPAEPLWGQIRDPEAFEGFDLESYKPSPRGVRKVLKAGRDFDTVILGLSIGALPCVASKIIAQNRKWQEMVAHVLTVRTQALQVWMKRALLELGWKEPSPVTSTYKPSLANVWADMTQSLAREDWPAGEGHHPRQVTYFCSVLPDLPGDGTCDPPSGKDTVKKNALHLLESGMAHLWPEAVGSGGELLWNLLVDNRKPPGEGKERFEAQFWVSVPNPSDRYVLSVPGSSRYRLRTDESGYRNLLLTGDWIQNTFNAGAAESAAMSGMATSSALSGYPKLQSIIGWGFGEPKSDQDR